MNILDKIKSRIQITDIANTLRAQGKIIVTTNGSFDIVHLGHLKSLNSAKSYGDVLIVGLNSDSSIKSYKSPNRPINNQNDRAYMLASLQFVDYVVIFDELTPIKFIKSIRPDLHVKSKSGYLGIEEEAVKKGGGKVILIEDEVGYSTTNLIQRIKNVEGST